MPQREKRRAVRGIVLLVAGLLAAVLSVDGSEAAGATRMSRTLRLGTQRLTRCSTSPLTYCGRLMVALDQGVTDGPAIAVGYRFYPAGGRVGSSSRTVVPVEGGPGYSTINSVSSGYIPMYGSLLRRWNMLAVDNRGTGSSTPLYCAALQNFSGSTHSGRFRRAIRRCAAALNHRWRYRDGTWVQASSLFGSVATAQDLATVIESLGLRKIDLYGDSYGSYFAQVFAGRFPQLVRSVILDSTYQIKDLDPWYRSTITAMPAAFNAVCRRSLACARAASGTSWSRLTRLAAALRRHSISADVPDITGGTVRARMGVVGLVDLLSDAAGDSDIYRAIDAAARAYLGDGNPKPLLRLYEQRLVNDEAYFKNPASVYSVELYLAVACTDYPQLFDQSSGGHARSAELSWAEQGAASSFAPFTVGEWLSQDANTEAYTACVNWPAARPARPSVAATPRLPKTVPVLVLGGELDTWTPPSAGRRVLAESGGTHRFIELANATHVVGEGDTVCGSRLVREFVADPSAIGRLDAACARTVSPIHAVGSYPTRLAQVVPITTSSRTRLPRALRQMAAVAVQTAGDAISRYDVIGYDSDRGLYGGQVRSSAAGQTLSLRDDQLVPGIRVSGTVRLGTGSGSAGDRFVRATLTVIAPDRPQVAVTARWATAGANASARVDELLGRSWISGTTPAP